MDNEPFDLEELSALAAHMGRERWRAVSDVAQVVAHYLRCHPAVEEVRYPGLKSDLQFSVAACKLVGGFGPHVRYRTAGKWHDFVCEPFDHDAESHAKQVVMSLEKGLSKQIF